jgi:hypothetical protein
MATYPKPIMKLSELIEMGFSEEYLMRIFNSHNQRVAWKASNKPNSKILFDTEELEKLRRKHCELH